MKTGAFVWRVTYRTNVVLGREAVSIAPMYTATVAVLTEGDALSDVRRALEKKLFVDSLGSAYLHIETAECLGFGVYPVAS